MLVDFTTGRRIDEKVRLLKGSDRKKFSKSLRDFVTRGYVITVLTVSMKVVPRIGKVITYYAELREEI